MAEIAPKIRPESDDLVSRLAEREEFLSSITANMPGVVYQFYARPGGDWGMHYVSEKAQEIFGISNNADTFVQEFIAHMGDEDRDRFIESIAHAVEREVSWAFDGRFVRPDGKDIFFRGVSTPKRKDKELVFHGLLLDITEQRVAERGNQEQSAILQATTDNLPGVVYEFFAEPDGRMGMHYVSEKSQEIFGLSCEPSDFVQRFVACIPDADKERFIDSIVCAAGIMEAWHYEGEFERPDGTRMYFRGDSVPSRRRGKNVFHGILLDLTEQRRVEEELRHAQKLDSIGQLAGGVAHDFNNMLGGIMGAAEMLRERHDDVPSSASLAQLIVETAERAGELTWQLLAFSRKAVRVRQPQDVHDVIERTIRILERSIDPRINIQRALTAPQATVLGDAGQLQAAFLNLGINARDAMPEGGLLRFETAVVKVLEEDSTMGLARSPGSYLRIRVIDTGVGIPPEVRPRIFEPFFTTKPTGQGTGMGLAAVYGTAAEHQGSISVIETSSRGTCFEMMLPLSGEQSAVETYQPSVPDVREQGRVLVIDDERIVREMAARLIQSLGYVVTEVGDPVEAVALFRRAPGSFDLVLLDMVMPHLNGEEVFHQLRAIRSDLPVVLCSGYALEESVLRLRQDGLAGHLKKPYRRAELREVLRGALEAANLARRA